MPRSLTFATRSGRFAIKPAQSPYTVVKATGVYRFHNTTRSADLILQVTGMGGSTHTIKPRNSKDIQVGGNSEVKVVATAEVEGVYDSLVAGGSFRSGRFKAGDGTNQATVQIADLNGPSTYRFINSSPSAKFTVGGLSVEPQSSVDISINGSVTVTGPAASMGMADTIEGVYDLIER